MRCGEGERALQLEQGVRLRSEMSTFIRAFECGLAIHSHVFTTIPAFVDQLEHVQSTLEKAWLVDFPILFES